MRTIISRFGLYFLAISMTLWGTPSNAGTTALIGAFGKVVGTTAKGLSPIGLSIHLAMLPVDALSNAIYPMQKAFDDANESYFFRVWQTYATDPDLMGQARNQIEIAVQRVNEALQKNSYPCCVSPSRVYLSPSVYDQLRKVGDVRVLELSADRLIDFQMSQSFAVGLAALIAQTSEFRSHVLAIQSEEDSFLDKAAMKHRLTFQDAINRFVYRLLELPPSLTRPFPQRFEEYKARLNQRLNETKGLSRGLEFLNHGNFSFRQITFVAQTRADEQIFTSCGAAGLESLFIQLPKCEQIPLRQIFGPAKSKLLDLIPSGLEELDSVKRHQTIRRIEKVVVASISTIAIMASLRTRIPLVKSSFLVRGVLDLGTFTATALGLNMLFPDSAYAVKVAGNLPTQIQSLEALYVFLDKSEIQIREGSLSEQSFQRELQSHLASLEAQNIRLILESN